MMSLLSNCSFHSIFSPRDRPLIGKVVEVSSKSIQQTYQLHNPQHKFPFSPLYQCKSKIPVLPILPDFAPPSKLPLTNPALANPPILITQHPTIPSPPPSQPPFLPNLNGNYCKPVVTLALAICDNKRRNLPS